MILEKHELTSYEGKPMKVEISEILPAKDPGEVLDILESELSEVADRVARSANQITAGRMKEASLGAINRTNIIFIARANGHHVLLIARLDYRTSFRFWGWLSFLVFTAFGWIIPIVAYFYQMRVAQSEFEEVIRRLKFECEFRLPKHSRI